MVKNLNTIDRGTKIRLGRWHNDDQADNTIVINASDTPINASNANALYMKPIRSDPSNSTLMTGFDPNTYEIVNTGLTRDEVVSHEVDYYANIGNTFTSTIKFEGDTSLTTEGVVGIANIEPIHTLDVGTKFYVDEEGANVPLFWEIPTYKMMSSLGETWMSGVHSPPSTPKIQPSRMPS